jgi:MSHA pilin protein MshD
MRAERHRWREPALGRRARLSGFTLIEIIVGLVLGTLAIAMVATLIVPLYTRSVEPILQIRAAELAQALLEDALARPFDHNTPLGGQPPCSAGGPVTCTAAGNLGPESGELDRGDFTDVDDYHRFCGGSHPIEDIEGVDLTASGVFAGYSFETCVVYDGNFDGVADSDMAAKLVTVTVTPPGAAAPVVASAYRGNY